MASRFLVTFAFCFSRLLVLSSAPRQRRDIPHDVLRLPQDGPPPFMAADFALLGWPSRISGIPSGKPRARAKTGSVFHLLPVGDLLLNTSRNKKMLLVATSNHASGVFACFCF